MMSMGMGGGMGMGSMGTGGMGGGMMGNTQNEMAFQLMLQQMGGQPQAQLSLLLPKHLLHDILIPQGHLSDIAQRCQIRIDLGADVSPNKLQVTLAGTLVGNTMAAYLLQER